MPTAPLTPCAQPGCPELVQGGRCDQHRAQRQTAHDHSRGSAASRGYDASWRNFLARFKTASLSSDRGLTGDALVETLLSRNRCAYCWNQDGKSNRRNLEHDHIVPLKRGGARLDPNNVQPLCHAHHVAKTRRESC